MKKIKIKTYISVILYLFLIVNPSGLDAQRIFRFIKPKKVKPFKRATNLNNRQIIDLDNLPKKLT